jgi:uncharacterized membrane protein (TIGR02234 family)
MNRVAVIATLVGALAVAAGALLRWVSVDYTDDLRGPVSVSAAGRELQPALLPLAFAALAALGAMLATGGVVRRVVGIVLSLVGVAVVVLAVTSFANGPGDLLPSTALAGSSEIHRSWIGLLVTVVGGVLLVAAGVLQALKPREGGLGRRYERRSTVPVDDELHLWRELDAHRDPTVDPSETSDVDPDGRPGR